MAAKQMIVAVCLMTAVLLSEARSAIHEKAKIPEEKISLYKKTKVPETKSDIELKAANPDTDLTTVR
jgi:hypothetical protein